MKFSPIYKFCIKFVIFVVACVGFFCTPSKASSNGFTVRCENVLVSHCIEKISDLLKQTIVLPDAVKSMTINSPITFSSSEEGIAVIMHNLGIENYSIVFDKNNNVFVMPVETWQDKETFVAGQSLKEEDKIKPLFDNTSNNVEDIDDRKSRIFYPDLDTEYEFPDGSKITFRQLQMDQEKANLGSSSPDVIYDLPNGQKTTLRQILAEQEKSNSFKMPPETKIYVPGQNEPLGTIEQLQQKQLEIDIIKHQGEEQIVPDRK